MPPADSDDFGLPDGADDEAAVVHYQMNLAERDAMDRAFWRSVVVIDDGYEG